MVVTNVKIFKASDRSNSLAYANIILDNYFIIRRIKLKENKKSGRYVDMPGIRTIKNGKKSRRDVCHPLNSDIRNEITEAIFEAYEEFKKEQENEE